jgi:hypothetical protein
MRSHHCGLFLPALCWFLVSNPSLSFASTDAQVWQCPGPDGTPLFTNKERADCQAMDLRPISVAPSYADIADHTTSTLPTTHREDSPFAIDQFSYDTPAGALRNLTSVPDWGREWQARNQLAGTVQGEICSLYGEWLRLNVKTRGGMFFGTDSSYGADPTGSNLRGPSFSFYDNARWVTLGKIFGTGFVPIGCP